MNASVITALNQITPAWVTSVLTRGGAPTRSAVQSFALGTGQGNWSTGANLALIYVEPDLAVLAAKSTGYLR